MLLGDVFFNMLPHAATEQIFASSTETWEEAVGGSIKINDEVPKIPRIS